LKPRCEVSDCNCAMGEIRTVYQKECQDFKHLKPRKGKRYHDAVTCTIIINSHSFTDTSCMSIPTDSPQNSLKSLHLKSQKIQVIQKLTAGDKQPRLQFTAYIYAQTLDK
jgi:hypothetical protein